MLCPVVSAAAAAVWLLAMLGPGLFLVAEDNSGPGFNLCGHCFYRQTPPLGNSAGLLLRPVCHKVPGGRMFATVSKPTCDTAIYSAFHLSHESTEREADEGEELVTKGEHNIKVAVPALLGGSKHAPHLVLPTDSPLQHWDATVTTLVHSRITPLCSTLGGDLYIITGVGSFRAAEDENGECQTKPLWSAVCCAVPEGKGGFSLGLIRETEIGEKQVSVKELEELLGVDELFSEGCGGTDEAVVVDSHTEGHTVKREKLHYEEVGDRNVNSETTDVDEDEEPEEVTQGTSADAVKSTRSGEEQHDVRHSVAVKIESPESSADYETLDKEETDTNSSSVLVYVLSTTWSIIKAPLWPVVSTVTQLPGQVIYVIQEDLGVLSALPGDTISVFHLLTSDLLSWTGSALEMLLDVGETIYFSGYYCTSSMLEALMTSCHCGVTGIGTLAGDTVGIFSGTMDNVWYVAKFFGGRLWEQSEDYVETVVSEMGGQAKAVGGGLGQLMWRSGNGVSNVFRVGESLITGMVDMVIGAVKEGFGQGSE
ncbi:Endonuclease domain-containing 1 protein [Channa argus]|uniref:Endonuclease domain-containing 1 protein n=1 Tax=Channa argus TaxID=215402 RepID=A0A6G1PP30_CHAAH|nr:Endonuclease domain-containing 1 protein [Channa argus]